MFKNEQYFEYRDAIHGERLPLAFIDLDALDANIDYVRRIVEGTGRTIRLGTKSIRCEPLTRRIIERGGASFRGLLTFTVEETAWLTGKGYDDMIVAYPTIQPSDLALTAQMAQSGKKVMLMVDHAGELCERFGELALIQNRKIVECVLTYRGEGKTFL
jgi:D-serine deaminase-like pyridoxal phosphate-dependent protein